MKDVVADVERQLQRSRDEIARKEELLVEQKEKNSNDIEKLESVLIEADAQHKEEYEKLKNSVSDKNDILYERIIRETVSIDTSEYCVQWT